MASRIPGVLILFLLLAGCAAPERDTRGSDSAAATETGASEAPLATAPCEAGDAFRRAMLAAVNRARRAAPNCGSQSMAPASALAWSPTLGETARIHSRDMARNDFVSHEGSDGSRVASRADAAGYPWRAIGENVGAGAGDVQEVVDHWLRSPGHCRNLLNADYSEFGAACVRAPDSRYGTYWTLVLGEPRPD